MSAVSCMSHVYSVQEREIEQIRSKEQYAASYLHERNRTVLVALETVGFHLLY